jgi:hypothetical protein
MLVTLLEKSRRPRRHPGSPRSTSSGAAAFCDIDQPSGRRQDMGGIDLMGRI